MHVAALGLGIASPHALALQAVPPVAQPQATPASDVIALQAANEVSE